MRGLAADHLRAAFWGGVQQLFPGYFAMVMATGIISIDMFFMGKMALSMFLMRVGQGVFALLSALLVLRAVRFPRQMRDDLLDPGVTFTFFTFVAAAGVLGMRASLGGTPLTAVLFWWVAVIAWLLLIYFVTGLLILHNEQPLAKIVNGGWLIAVVATQSVAMLTASLADHLVISAETARIFGFLGWSVGVVWYGVLIVFIMLRLVFSPLIPQQMSPPYWINMGAVAISTVAGVVLWDAVPASAILRPAAPFIYSLTLGLWSWGTWWIPLLIGFGIWKHAVRRYPLSYEPGLWSIVFPLGMYAAALLRIAGMTGSQVLVNAGHAFAWVALSAWSLATLGLVRSLGRVVATPPGGMPISG